MVVLRCVAFHLLVRVDSLVVELNLDGVVDALALGETVGQLVESILSSVSPVWSCALTDAEVVALVVVL